MLGRSSLFIAAALAFAAIISPVRAEQPEPENWASQHDIARQPIIDERINDWRVGAIVYQVLVDRFAPSADLEAKRDLYPAPKKLRTWDEVPKAGTFVESAQVWSHEIDFWGGDLQSVRTKLDYLQALGVDVVYLNPIQLAYTNHKYDAQDYAAVSPEYGTRDDVKALAEDLHGRKMRLVLDGVFNHMGRTSPKFQDAIKNPQSPYRDWFFIGAEYKMGYRGWLNVANLPEVRHENPAVRAKLWGDPDSVVQGYLSDGVDGWRLDVAFDYGFKYLTELTEGAHRAKPGSLTVGEIYNYPEEWFPALDAVMNMNFSELIKRYAQGKIEGAQVGRMFERTISDADIEPILRSWIVLDNHDRKRLKTELPEEWRRHMAQLLQFTLPGSPCVYYGVEVGMEGGEDPEQRGPMRWDLANDSNPEFTFLKNLIAIRKSTPGLRHGDFRLLDSTKLLAFSRRTDRVADTAIVVCNTTDGPVKEVLETRESKLMDNSKLFDALSKAEVDVKAGVIEVTVPAHSAMILKPLIVKTIEYTHYKRVQ